MGTEALEKAAVKRTQIDLLSSRAALSREGSVFLPFHEKRIPRAENQALVMTILVQYSTGSDGAAILVATSFRGPNRCNMQHFICHLSAMLRLSTQKLVKPHKGVYAILTL